MKLFGPQAHDFFRDNPIDIRHVGPLTFEAERDPSLRATSNLVWLRADGELPDDPLLHVCLMTYASDMTLLDSVLLAHGLSWADGRTTGASLDHAMWFHRPFRADRWLLYAQDSPVAARRQGARPRRGLHLRRRARGVSSPGGTDPEPAPLARATAVASGLLTSPLRRVRSYPFRQVPENPRGGLPRLAARRAPGWLRQRAAGGPPQSARKKSCPGRPWLRRLHPCPRAH